MHTMVCVGQAGAKTRFQTLTPKKKGKKIGIVDQGTWE